jgi:hypothetical protein
MRFKSAAIDQFARMICGDSPLPFPYRSSSALTTFFTGLGLDHVHHGESRNPWCRDALITINNKSPVDGDFPSVELIAVVEELMNPVYFDSAPAEEVDYEEALRRINLILKQYDLEVTRDATRGAARLCSVDGSFVSTAKSAQASVRKITFSPLVFNVPEEEAQDDLVSVMMPFASEFKVVYAAMQSACKLNNLRCKRVDDIWANSTVIQDIFDLIFVSRIVVVDFTGRNANVMYETGIAHTLGKHVVPITQSLTDVPFDLQSHRVLKYLPNTEGLADLAQELSQRLETLVKGHSWSQ